MSPSFVTLQEQNHAEGKAQVVPDSWRLSWGIWRCSSTDPFVWNIESVNFRCATLPARPSQPRLSHWGRDGGHICCVCSKRKHAPGYICCRIKLNSFVISLCPIIEIIPPPPGLHRLRQKREGQTHHRYQLCCYCWLLNEKYSRSNRENITQCNIMTDRLAKKIQLIPFRRCFKHGTFFGPTKIKRGGGGSV